MKDIFDCDSRHPKYDRATKVEASVLIAKIFLGDEERFALRFVDFEYCETIDGLQVTASKPDFSCYIAQPDDLEADVQFAIEEELGRKIQTLNWF